MFLLSYRDLVLTRAVLMGFMLASLYPLEFVFDLIETELETREAQ